MPSEQTPQGGRILVVDDESSVREILQDFLSFEGFRVALAEDGEKGLEYVLSEPFDLVLTDLEMPNMNGLEFLAELKQMKNPPSAIMMTGYGTVESAIEAMKVGAYDYILKPFQIEELAHLIRKALDHKRLAEENIRLHELISLYQISDDLNAARAIGDIARVVRDACYRELEPDLLVIWQLEEGRWRRASTIAGDLAPEGTAAELDEFDSVGLLKAFHEDQPLILGPADAGTYFPRLSAPPTCAMVVPMRAQGRVIGMIGALLYQQNRVYTEGNRKTLQLYGDRAAVTLENLQLYDHLKQTFMQTIESLVGALEAKDEYTRGHSERVSAWAVLIGEQLGLDEPELEDLKRGSLLHDIGKIGLNLDTLNKPGGLTDDEYARFKLHPVLSKRILEPIEFLRGALPTVLHHHERWDGGGYPLGLAGERIPLGARILAIADSFEVMITDRVYRAALPLADARRELERCAGTQFDPKIVDAFLGYLDRYASADELPVKGGRRGGEPWGEGDGDGGAHAAELGPAAPTPHLGDPTLPRPGAAEEAGTTTGTES